MGTGTRTLVALTVDTEEEWDWSGPWPTDEPVVRNVLELPQLQDICSRRGAAVTYFANAAVMCDPAARRLMLDFAARARVEIGMHIHPWNTPPLGGPRPVQPEDTFLENLPTSLVEAKLTSVYQLFLDAGLRPTSFRGGRYSSGPKIQKFLQRHGFTADSSIVPFTTWADRGAPDFRGCDGTPVRHAPPAPGATALWELPLTCAYTREPEQLWHRIHQSVEQTVLRGLHIIGILDRLGIVTKAWLNFESQTEQELFKFLAVLRQRQPRYIIFTVHSSSLVAGATPYTRTAADERRLLATIENVLTAVERYPEFEPATIGAIASTLESENHESTRHQPAR